MLKILLSLGVVLEVLEGYSNMNINDIIIEASSVEKAKKEQQKLYKQKLKQVPAMSKQLLAQVSNVLVKNLNQNPNLNPGDEVARLINGFMKFKKYKAPAYAGDVNNDKELAKYISDQITAKYQEEVLGVVDINNDGKDDISGKEIKTIPANVTKYLDTLDNESKKQLAAVLKQGAVL